MSRFWFLSAPLFSHSDWGGFLKTAQALQARGHDVLWVSERPLAAAIASAGLPFAEVAHTGWLWPPPPAPDLAALTPAEAVMLRYRRALDTWLSEDLVALAVDDLLALAAQRGAPDALVTDPFLSASAIAAEKLGVPLAVCGWIAQTELNEDSLFPVQKALAHESVGRVERLCARFGVQGVNFAPGPTPSVLSPHLHISYFNDAWYAADAATLLPQTQFVGGMTEAPTTPAPDWLAAIPGPVPLAFITLGTVFTGDLGFHSWAAQAAARAGLLPVVALGWNPISAEDKAQLKAALPPQTRLLNYAPLDHVLPRCKLIIHHGGMGTTHAAVLHGLPQIAVPHAADQRGNARRIAQAHAGLNLTAHDVKQGALLAGARALTADERVQANVRALAADFASLGGPERAAELIEGIIVA
ncbi:MAG: glycosyltransferase family 1 protein [Anaerolineae bacterium]|nr:glycosyltransferase family 1 protein [Anaerolineae bacterium]